MSEVKRHDIWFNLDMSKIGIRFNISADVYWGEFNISFWLFCFGGGYTFDKHGRKKESK